ncbi:MULTISPECIES: hypothetical protein [Marinobacter]|uniref:hypothetical protein n=1 Tax=Marinobacter TaxID=2742 RepID=UPI003B437465|nr:hypothetical protein PBN92_14945 [Marinobacter alkaliphilus]
MQQCIREDASLTLAREGNDQELATSFATIAGRTSEEAREGTVLEACIQHGNRYLLFLTDDIPFEDSLHIHLLDEDLDRIDTVTLGAPYTTGHFRNLKCEDSSGITFEFFGDCVWKIVVLPKKRLRLPFFSGQKGVSWQKGWFHVLELRDRK